MLITLVSFHRAEPQLSGQFSTRVNNLRHNKRLNRFTLRGQQKVDGQWKLYCLVHNIEKLAHHGYGQ